MPRIVIPTHVRETLAKCAQLAQAEMPNVEFGPWTIGDVVAVAAQLYLAELEGRAHRRAQFARAQASSAPEMRIDEFVALANARAPEGAVS